jgi:hypothetical protein
MEESRTLAFETAQTQLLVVQNFFIQPIVHVHLSSANGFA